MYELSYLRDLVIILAVAVAVVALLHRIKVPPIAALVLAGMLVGPDSLGLIDDVHDVELLAEVGVALLLFGIGLELSIDKIRRLWWYIVVGGLLQVGITAAVATAIVYFFGLPLRQAVFFGLAVALSSTAIVLRGLQARGEVDAPHGRLTLGVLVFQDFAVVPIMLAMPLLAGSDVSSGDVVKTLVLVPLIIIGVLIVAALVAPRILALIVRTRQRNLFVLTVLVICIGVAYAVSSSGVSLALGAFLAGLVVAGSEYRHQAISDLLPFKDVFTSLFFVSVGMFIDPGQLLENAGPIAAMLVAILIGKSLIMFIVAAIVRMPLRVAVLSAVALAQVGEFSFILFRAAQGTALYVEPLMSNLLAAAILSMFLTPFAIAIGPHLAAGAIRLQSLERRLGVKTAEDASETDQKLSNHVIIGGYGFAGRNLASALRDCGVAYVIADLNSVNVREARQSGEPAYFADITSSKVLQLLGAERARQFVIVINDPNATFLAIRAAKRAAPNLKVMARITYIQDKDAAFAAGADDVVPAEQEAAVEVARRVLVTCKPEIAEKPEQLEELRKTVELSEDEG